jgi:hypothetical protein
MSERTLRVALPLLTCLFLLAPLAACGGSGGSGTGETIPGVVLVNFEQSGQDNVPLNRVLKFIFSAAIDPNSVGPASIQIRKGPTFGEAVFGKYIVDENVVRFEPRLPGLCDLSDAGLLPDTDYRVSVIGSPEEFAIRNLAGAPMQGTISASFHTRLDTDPELFEDQIPATSPSVVSSTPTNGAYPTHFDPSVAATVLVHQGNSVVIELSENVDPCTVNQSTILFQQYATGDGQQTPSDPPGSKMPTGFDPETDQTPSDPFTWGSGTVTAPPRRVRADFKLEQDFLSTRVTLTPTFGEFPDNALLVVQVSNQIRDFGGNAMLPSTFAFVTENRAPQTLPKAFEFDGDVPILENISTGEVNTARSVSKAQGFLLFAGDSDNGANLNQSSSPDNLNGPVGCTTSTVQPNDGNPDDFDPIVDTVLDTGATRNTCLNSTDGSTAVVYEFRSFHVRNGVTVRVIGRNPAIVLVTGDVVIEAGARILVRGDGNGGAPQSNGGNGTAYLTPTQHANSVGGTAVAGGGNGGTLINPISGSQSGATTGVFGGNGEAGFGSPDQFLTAGLGGAATPVRIGAGRGSGSVGSVAQQPVNVQAGSGGGGGHAQGPTFVNAGVAGGAGSTGKFHDFPADPDGLGGRGGGIYGAVNGRMPTPEAGSGGGSGGLGRPMPWQTAGFYNAGGGAGGAGGGFIDFTSAHDIKIFGTIDAAGGRGGNAGAHAFYGSSGGGGGGSGGGIRLLTPGMVEFGPTTVVTTAGGNGGGSGVPGAGFGTAPANPGAPGGNGRLVVEDDDSVITGFGGGLVVPTEGSNGFYRGPFDATRFVGGGIRPVVVTDIIDMGPVSPSYVTPIQNYTIQEDFITGVPAVSSRGLGKTALFIEAQGFTTNPDGSVNLLSATGWKSVGYFIDSGAELFPTWVPNAKPPVADVPASQLQPGNTGNGISQVNGRQFLQFRISFFLNPGMGPFDPGPYIDRWITYIQYDQ